MTGTVLLAPDDELVEVHIFPACDALQNSVEPGDRGVALHLEMNRPGDKPTLDHANQLD
jgi:hypothetical protein